ncbi:hypothetical protein ACP70R_004144 [Stipagrostis hirtigluma subsp. patula]
MEPPATRRKKAAAARVPATGGADRLSALPDAVLRQILSFLPAQEAVRTCVLARIWRDLWKLTPRLRIAGSSSPASVQDLRGFVDHMLSLRFRGLENAPLDSCEITFGEFADDDVPLVNRWIRRAVECCHVKALLVDMWRSMAGYGEQYLGISDEPLFSHHLTRMLSPSLKRLVITTCVSDLSSRFRISAPSLVSLRLYCPSDRSRTPVLLSMPELRVAYVYLSTCADDCRCDDRMNCNHVMATSSCASSHTDDDGAEDIADDEAIEDTSKCVLLEGLSQASNLTLISEYYNMYIFRRDLRWCPTFSKLKTLSLDNYWCELAGCPALACLLEHAPVLEKLTILFDKLGTEYKVEIKGCCDAMERSTKISEHLNMVEVKFEVVNEEVLNFLMFMGTLNIWFKFRGIEASTEDGSTTS